jgi:hypothetical protein
MRVLKLQEWYARHLFCGELENEAEAQGDDLDESAVYGCYVAPPDDPLTWGEACDNLPEWADPREHASPEGFDEGRAEDYDGEDFF